MLTLVLLECFSFSGCKPVKSQNCFLKVFRDQRGHRKRSEWPHIHHKISKCERKTENLYTPLPLLYALDLCS